MKKNKGITLTSLIITIIIILILAGIIIVLIDEEFGIVEKASNAKFESEIAQYKEKIGIEYTILKNSKECVDKNNIQIFEMLKEKLNFETEFIGSECMIIQIIDGEFITLVTDGTIVEGKKLYLNIEDGDIDLKTNGVIQNNTELIEYQGDYVISGTTTEYSVRIMEEGIYNITIKNLNIDMTGKEKCAFNANRGYKPTGCYVNINIEENNKLIGDSAPGLGFAKATPNINGITNGSTLSINGNGTLEVTGGKFSAAIGGGYTGFENASGDVSNIIINSGNIIANTGINGCAIGGGLRKNVNNIIINGGNINAIASNRAGIGASAEGILQNLVINGGNITITGGEYGGAIGGGQGSGEILIKGGIINAKHEFNFSSNNATIGQGCSSVRIESGVVNCYSKEGIGIGTMNEALFNLEILGGEVNVDSKICAIPNNIEKGTKMYLVKVKLENMSKQNKVTNLITSDNLNYKIDKMYTAKDGYVYIYLPEGERTITIESNDKIYTGTIITNLESYEITTLIEN